MYATGFSLLEKHSRAMSVFPWSVFSRSDFYQPVIYLAALPLAAAVTGKQGLLVAG